MASTLQIVLSRIAQTLGTVSTLLAGDDGPLTLLRVLGWELPPGASDIGLSALDLSDVLSKLDTLSLAIDVGTTGVSLAGDYADLAEAVGTLLQGLDGIAAGFAAPADYLQKTDIKDQFLPRLFDYLTVEALNCSSMFSVGLALFTGLVELQPLSRDDSIYQAECVRKIVHWDRVPRLFGDLPQLLADVYGWGSGFRSDRDGRCHRRDPARLRPSQCRTSATAAGRVAACRPGRAGSRHQSVNSVAA